MEIDSKEIHLWFASESDFPLWRLEEQCLPWLSDQEVARFRRFRIESSRHEYLLGQMLTRATLTEYLGKPADSWEFVAGVNGKPMMVDSPGIDPLYFNLSHSNGRAVFAMGGQDQIGVDLEIMRSKRRINKIALRHFSSSEVEQLEALDAGEQLSRFYELWTLKESYIKATGQGLTIPLDSFGFDIAGESLQFWQREEVKSNRQNWQFWQLDYGADYRLSLGCCPDESAISRLRYFSRSGLDRFEESQVRVLRNC